MKKMLLVAIVALCAVQMNAYEIDIENEIDDSTIEVTVEFEGDFPAQTFTLERHRRAGREGDYEATIKNIPAESPVKQNGITVRGLTGSAEGQTTTFSPRRMSRDFELNIDLEHDDKGNVAFEFDEDRG